MFVLLASCRRIPMKMGTRYFQRVDAAAAVSTMYMQDTAWRRLPAEAAGSPPYSTTAARRIGQKKEIGAGLKGEEIRPGERSQVCFCWIEGAGTRRLCRGGRGSSELANSSDDI